jgi:hypothetical protein
MWDVGSGSTDRQPRKLTQQIFIVVRIYKMGREAERTIIGQVVALKRAICLTLGKARVAVG